MGVLSPNGSGAEAFWQATKRGVSGVDQISLFDPSALSCQIAGEVKDFHPEAYLSPKDLKRVGRSVSLAIAAATEALQSARVNPEFMTLDERRSWGVVLGSGGGAPDFTEEQYRLFFSGQLRKTSAYNISSSTLGTLSSEISVHFEML